MDTMLRGSAQVSIIKQITNYIEVPVEQGNRMTVIDQLTQKRVTRQKTQLIFKAQSTFLLKSTTIRFGIFFELSSQNE